MNLTMSQCHGNIWKTEINAENVFFDSRHVDVCETLVHKVFLERDIHNGIGDDLSTLLMWLP